MSEADATARRLQPYLDLVAAFVARKITPAEFRRRYIDTYLKDDSDWPDKEFEVLESLSGDVEVYVADPELRPHIPSGIGEEELRASAERALERIRILMSGRP